MGRPVDLRVTPGLQQQLASIRMFGNAGITQQQANSEAIAAITQAMQNNPEFDEKLRQASKTHVPRRLVFAKSQCAFGSELHGEWKWEKQWEKRRDHRAKRNKASY